MKVDRRSNERGVTLIGLAVFVAALLIAVYPLAVQSQEKPNEKESGNSVGFVLSDDATAKDLGLPIYPGAQKLKDKSDESPVLQMGLWGGSSGFRLVLLKLQSNDPPNKVADFYRKALAKYGKVLDCGASSAKQEKSGKRGALDCDSDQPVAGGFALKSGTKERQHVVAVEPDGSHSHIALVYLEAPPNNTQN